MSLLTPSISATSATVRNFSFILRILPTPAFRAGLSTFLQAEPSKYFFLRQFCGYPWVGMQVLRRRKSYGRVTEEENSGRCSERVQARKSSAVSCRG